MLSSDGKTKYAMKAILDDFIYTDKDNVKRLMLREREFGFLGYKNNFLLKSIASFRLSVIILNNITN